MLKVTKTGPNRVDLELSGTIDAVTMRVALDELIAISDDVENGQMLYKIPEFAMPTPAAMGVELTYLPSLFSLIGKYDRCAVLTDAGWLKKAAEIEGAIIPGIDIKSFDLEDVEAAERWLSDEA